MNKLLTKLESNELQELVANNLRVKRFNLTFIFCFVSILSHNVYAKDIDCPANLVKLNNGEWCDAYNAEQHQRLVDKQLNTVYRSFIKNQPENIKKKWVLAQKTWISYRDAHCSAVQGYRPSSPSTAQDVYQSCSSEETEKRIQILKNYCEERGCE